MATSRMSTKSANPNVMNNSPIRCKIQVANIRSVGQKFAVLCHFRPKKCRKSLIATVFALSATVRQPFESADN